MTISLVSSVPVQNSTDNFVNKAIELTFDKAISTTSLTGSIFAIIDIDTGTSVPLTVTLSTSSAATVLLHPSQTLKENTQYRIIIVGTDMSLGYSLVAADADTLTTSISIEFSTGTSVYKIDTTVQKQASNLTLEGDLFLPTNVKALGYEFTVNKVRPKNNTHGVNVALTGDYTVRFTFSKNLETGADYTEWATVEAFPLLNDDSYLASGGTISDGTIPGYTISATGTDLLVTFSGEIPNNVGIHINLLDEITSSDGDEYGGNLKYSINTQLYPEVYGVQLIEREVREVVDVYSRDYIGALLFKNTIWLWEKLGRTFSLDSFPYAAKQYVAYTTILDLMEDREYYKYVVAGTRRQLGDLGVSVDNIIGRIAMKVAKYKDAKDVAYASLTKGWQFKVGTTTAAYELAASEVNRLWYDVNGRYTATMYSYSQDPIPAANVGLNRHARMNNPFLF